MIRKSSGHFVKEDEIIIFNSISFVFLFLPIVLAIYYLVPEYLRISVLVISGVVFYFYAGSNPTLYLLLLGISTVVTYYIARRIELTGDKRLLALGLVFLGAELMFFKCYDGGSYLPVGMSFYSFQIAAYLIDVYRRRICADKSLLLYSAEVVMFPKLLMGPLVEPKQLKKQVKSPKCSYELFYDGIREFVIGLAMKVMLANRVGGIWSQAITIGYESISTPFAWLALICYAMQLYFDFWSYSIMAVGIGKMLGFSLPENFRDPYASKSVSEFWRRWHITLGAWFREYIYIPLGGNRKGTMRTIFNLAIVWLFTGLWHGVGGNYLLWALILFFFVINERLWLRRVLERIGPLANIYAVVAILISWIPFAIGDTSQMLAFAAKIFGAGSPALNSHDWLIWGKEYLGLLIAGVVFATPLPRIVWKKIRKYAVTDVLIFALFWVSIFYIATSAQDPFLYFQY